MTATMPETVVEALGRRLPACRLVTDQDVLRSLSHDDAESAPAGEAAAAVRVRSEHEVQQVVRTCAELGVPVVPAGRAPACPAGPMPSPVASCSTCPR